MSGHVKISGDQQVAEAERAFVSVFRNADPFDAPFRPEVESRLLLFPTDYELDEPSFAALARASATLGEGTAFLSTIEGLGRGPRPIVFEQAEHWKLATMDYPYRSLEDLGWTGLTESAIYSTGGTWGLLISHEEHAVVGGPARFIERLRSGLPDSDGQTRKFLESWKNNRERLGSDIGWLPGLLAHVYGRDRSLRLLESAGLA